MQTQAPIIIFGTEVVNEDIRSANKQKYCKMCQNLFENTKIEEHK